MVFNLVIEQASQLPPLSLRLSFLSSPRNVFFGFQFLKNWNKSEMQYDDFTLCLYMFLACSIVCAANGEMETLNPVSAHICDL